nr:retrovirus-related Pol polyprotein from transposon TNT 1-94 [Tanacetum cinerariifolium]
SEHPIEAESLAPIIEEDVVPVRRSARTPKASNRLCLNVEIVPDQLYFNVEVKEHSLGDKDELASYKASLSDPEFEKWLVAMNAEIKSMYDNKVWKLVDLPPSAKVVKSKWIYKKKTNMDGVVYNYKARLVAKGFTQTYGVDYEETFSPVADIRAIRILIAITAYYDYEIWKMDIKTSFLNGLLDEEIYMEQPEGFVDPDHTKKVCKLQISIYRLKKASRSWNKRFDEEIKKFGFHQNLDEPCVYQKASGSNIIFLILYVDDIILMGNHKPSLQEVKDYLDDKARMQNVPYASAVGSIMYAVRCTRPDVAFAQNITSRFQQSPGEAHWTAVKNILKYLRRTKDMFLVYGGNFDAELQVKCYCDAELRPIKMIRNLKLAEYIAAVKATKEAVWTRKFVDELGVVPSNNYPIEMNCDNTAAISMAKEPGIMKRARHFQRKFHYVREFVETGKIKMVKVYTDDNLADPFTKALAGLKLTRHARSMGLRPASSF